jgi:hypothetical protein
MSALGMEQPIRQASKMDAHIALRQVKIGQN